MKLNVVDYKHLLLTFYSRRSLRGEELSQRDFYRLVANVLDAVRIREIGPTDFIAYAEQIAEPDDFQVKVAIRAMKRQRAQAMARLGRQGVAKLKEKSVEIRLLLAGRICPDLFPIPTYNVDQAMKTEEFERLVKERRDVFQKLEVPSL